MAMTRYSAAPLAQGCEQAMGEAQACKYAWLSGADQNGTMHRVVVWSVRMGMGNMMRAGAGWASEAIGVGAHT